MISPESGLFHPEVLDAVWFTKFHEIITEGASLDFMNSKIKGEEMKKIFLSDPTQNPQLEYPHLDLKRINDRENALMALKKEILEQEQNEWVRILYRTKINEEIGRMRMYRCSIDGNMKWFTRWSQFLYGRPSRGIFAYTMDTLSQRIRQAKEESDDSDLITAAEALAAVVPSSGEILSQHTNNITAPYVPEVPNEDDFLYVKKEVLAELETLMYTNDVLASDNEIYADTAIQQYFMQALERVGAPDWKVLIDESNNSSIRVTSKREEVKIPEGREESLQKIQQLLLHEISTHVRRSAAGSRSRLKLLSIGLDRYHRGEEGVATMKEQGFRDPSFDDFSGFIGYFSIGLVLGLDGTKRDFKDLFQMLYPYYVFDLLTKRKPDQSMEDITKLAEQLAWNRCIRTFRGADGHTHGACSTKDVVYRDGNIGIWNVIEKDKEQIHQFSVGKFDPSNDQHVYLLHQLHILGEDDKMIQEESPNKQ